MKECNKNTNIAELETDPCRGCMTSDRCINISDRHDAVEFIEGTLQDFILKLMTKIEDLENRVETLELLNDV